MVLVFLIGTLSMVYFFIFRPGGKATFDAEALVIKAQMVQKDSPKSNGQQPAKVKPSVKACHTLFFFFSFSFFIQQLFSYILCFLSCCIYLFCVLCMFFVAIAFVLFLVLNVVYSFCSCGHLFYIRLI